MKPRKLILSALLLALPLLSACTMNPASIEALTEVVKIEAAAKVQAAQIAAQAPVPTTAEGQIALQMRLMAIQLTGTQKTDASVAAAVVNQHAAIQGAWMNLGGEAVSGILGLSRYKAQQNMLLGLAKAGSRTVNIANGGGSGGGLSDCGGSVESQLACAEGNEAGSQSNIIINQGNGGAATTGEVRIGSHDIDNAGVFQNDTGRNPAGVLGDSNLDGNVEGSGNSGVAIDDADKVGLF